MQIRHKCKWVKENEDVSFYYTSCSYTFIDSNENLKWFKFCPYCGREIN